MLYDRFYQIQRFLFDDYERIMKDIKQLLNRFPDMEKMIGEYEYGTVTLTEVLDKLIELEEKRIWSEATWTELFAERTAIK